MAYPFKDTFPGEWADADRAYHIYVENCRRMGIAPLSWNEAKVQRDEWLAKLSAGRSTPHNLQ